MLRDQRSDRSGLRAVGGGARPRLSFHGGFQNDLGTYTRWNSRNSLRDTPSLRSEKFNWQFLTFWLTYLGVILGSGYAIL